LTEFVTAISQVRVVCPVLAHPTKSRHAQTIHLILLLTNVPIPRMAFPNFWPMHGMPKWPHSGKLFNGKECIFNVNNFISHFHYFLPQFFPVNSQ
jgi:hypothetical protein